MNFLAIYPVTFDDGDIPAVNAAPLDGAGVLVVTNGAAAFVPGACIREVRDPAGKVLRRSVGQSGPAGRVKVVYEAADEASS